MAARTLPRRMPQCLSARPCLAPACPRAQVLFSEDGYVYLDVRSQLENEEIGKVKGSVNIPFVHARRVWNAEEGKKVRQGDTPGAGALGVLSRTKFAAGIAGGGMTVWCEAGCKCTGCLGKRARQAGD